MEVRGKWVGKERGNWGYSRGKQREEKNIISERKFQLTPLSTKGNDGLYRMVTSSI